MTAPMQQGMTISAVSTQHLGMSAIGGQRLCGNGRTADSVYLECGVYLYGTPVEQHLLDPPMPIDPVQYGLSAQGIKVIDIKGTRHILDQVGATHYPEVCDFIEEARHMGISRKIPLTADVTGLSSGSTLMLVHSRANIKNAAAVSKDSDMLCPPPAWGQLCGPPLGQRTQRRAGSPFTEPGKIRDQPTENRIPGCRVRTRHLHGRADHLRHSHSWCQWRSQSQSASCCSENWIACSDFRLLVL